MSNGYIPGQAFKQAQIGVMGQRSTGDMFQRAIMMAELAERRKTSQFNIRLSEREYGLAQGRLAIDQERLSFEMRRYEDALKLAEKKAGAEGAMSPKDYFKAQLDATELNAQMALQVREFMETNGDNLSRRTRALMLDVEIGMAEGNDAMVAAGWRGLENSKIAGPNGYVTENNVLSYQHRFGYNVRLETVPMKQWLEFTIDPRAKRFNTIVHRTLDKLKDTEEFGVDFPGKFKLNKSDPQTRASTKFILDKFMAELFTQTEDELKSMVDEGIDMTIGEQETWKAFVELRSSFGETGLTKHKLASYFSEAFLDPEISRATPYALLGQKIISNMGGNFSEWEAQPAAFEQVMRTLSGMKDIHRQKMEQKILMYGPAGIPPQQLDPRSSVALLAIPDGEIFKIAESQKIGSETYRAAEKTMFPITSRFKHYGLFDDIIEISAREGDKEAIKAVGGLLTTWLQDMDDNLWRNTAASRDKMQTNIHHLQEFVLRRAEMATGTKPIEIVENIDKVLRFMRDGMGLPISIPQDYSKTVRDMMGVEYKPGYMPMEIPTRFTPEEAPSAVGLGAPEYITKEEELETLRRLRELVKK